MTIERAAKAIAAVQCIEIGDYVREEARAALEAIAEPTPEMIDAGIRAFDECHGELIVAAIWRAMHAAMLKEPK